MKNFAFQIRTDVSTGQNDRFWAAAGMDSLFPSIFTDAGEYLLRRMQKYGTCKYLRCHYTLSSHAVDGFEEVGGNVYSEDENGNPVYHFEYINRVFARYLEFGIKPIVEYDFLPFKLSRNVRTGGDEEGVYLNRSYPNDWDKWRTLITAFTRNLAETFGAEEVRTWYFEVWNEADGWPFEDWPQFHRLYDVFADAVSGVDENLKIGGPGGFKPDFMRAFLEHVSCGRNYVTGEIGTRIDYISYHIYGYSGSWSLGYPLVYPTVQTFVNKLLYLQRTIEDCGLGDREFLLDEWGMVSHYEKDSTRFPVMNLRNTAFAGLFTIKLADNLLRLRQTYHQPLTMALYWGFAEEDETVYEGHRPFNGNRSLTTAHHIPKPVQTAQELLSRLGVEFLQTDGYTDNTLGCIAARDADTVQALLYNFCEEDPDGENPARKGTVTLEALEDGEYRISCIRLDQEHHNTYEAWIRAGSPMDLSDKAFDKIRDAAKLCEDETWTAAAVHGKLTLSLTVPSCGAALLEIRKL